MPNAPLLEFKDLLKNSDYSAADIKISTLEFKYSDKKEFKIVSPVINFVKAHIAFAHGQFDSLEKLALQEIAKAENGASPLASTEILGLKKLLAQKYFIFNQDSNLKELVSNLDKKLIERDTDEAFFLSNSIKAMYLSVQGEHKQALNISNLNAQIAQDNNYSGYMSPINSNFVKCICLFAMADVEMGISQLEVEANSARKLQLWPWYFLAHGQMARQLASNNRIGEALDLIKQEREIISSFKFDNELSILADANELYIRSVLKDLERIDVLLKRLPELTLVKQIRAARLEWAGKDILKWIENLPEENARQQLYKLIALSEYYKESSSKSVEFMSRALQIAERTGATEFILRQHNMYEIVLKAASKNVTPYLEDISRRITERVAITQSYSPGGLSNSLTPREQEILRHLSTGLTIKAIGEVLNLSMNTMKTHVKNIYRKLEVDKREKAIEKAKILLLI